MEVVRKPIRTLRLVVRSPDGPVRVSAPARLGDEVILRFVAEKQGWIRRQQARLAAAALRMPTFAGTPEEEALLYRNYRDQLRALVPPLLDRWQPVIGVSITAWGLRRMKTRWGSCNTRARRIWLNTELARHPPACLEYVLVHELVHLLERGHNSRFYAHLDRFLPAWRDSRAHLNGHHRC